MILTLTPNPALDLTYRVDAVTVHGEHRVREVRSAPGGKGVNVARVLTQLATETICTGPLGGTVGEQLRELLSAVPGVQQAWTPIDAATRRTVTVVDGAGATAFNEPGPVVSPAELTALGINLSALLDATKPVVEAVAISGSLPPGIAGDDLADLVRTVIARDRPVIVDTSGPGLLAAARAGASLLKPNAAEAVDATGEATPTRAAAALIALGARRVVCSLGRDGLLALEADPRGARGWRAWLDEPVSGNPTGAGDSVVAVLAAALRSGTTELPAALARAVAVSASAVTRPVAGEVDLALAAQLEPTVQIKEIRCP